MDLLPFEDDDELMMNYSASYSVGEYTGGNYLKNSKNGQ
jgi:hypothetical protein